MSDFDLYFKDVMAQAVSEQPGRYYEAESNPNVLYYRRGNAWLSDNIETKSYGRYGMPSAKQMFGNWRVVSQKEVLNRSKETVYNYL